MYARRAMRIFTEQAIKEYAERHPESKVALQDWVQKVKKSEWSCFADVKKTFNSVDNVGNQRYVFTIRFVYVRFIGTHKEYDRIDCRNI